MAQSRQKSYELWRLGRDRRTKSSSVTSERHKKRRDGGEKVLTVTPGNEKSGVTQGNFMAQSRQKSYELWRLGRDRRSKSSSVTSERYNKRRDGGKIVLTVTPGNEKSGVTQGNLMAQSRQKMKSLAQRQEISQQSHARINLPGLRTVTEMTARSAWTCEEQLFCKKNIRGL